MNRQQKIAKKIVLGFKYKITLDAVKSAKRQFLRELRSFEKSFMREVEKLGLQQSFHYDDDWKEVSYKTVPRDKQNDYKNILDEMDRWMSKYSRQLEKYFYDVLLGRHMEQQSHGIDRKELNYYADKLQTSAWLLVTSLTATDLKYPKYRDFEKNVKYVFDGIRRKARKAFKDAMEFAEFSNEADKEYTFAEITNWRNFTFIPENGVSEDAIKKAVFSFSEAVKLIKRAGYGSVVKDRMDVVISGLSKRNMTAAEYHPDKDEIMVYYFGIGDVKTIVHELGHRLYYHTISNGDRDLWKALYNGDLIKITEQDIERVIDEIPACNDEFSGIYKETIVDAIDKYIRKWKNKDPLAEAKGRVFYRKAKFAKDCDALKRIWKMYFEDKPVMLNYISDYGNTNEKEAFAELFTEIVMGKRVDPQAKAWFDMVVK